MSNPGTYVATVNVRDDFFNDPFFKDWWSEFEGPVKVLDTPGNIERKKYSMQNIILGKIFFRSKKDTCRFILCFERE